MEVGQRVGLRFFPFCDGTIIEILEPLKVGSIIVAQKYRVKWDKAKYGVSDWLSDHDLLKL
jgi:hypothetical protein